MARAGLHPVLRKMTVVMTNGATFQVLTPCKKIKDNYHLTADKTTHHAWTGKERQIEDVGQVAKFNSRFKHLTLSDDKSE